MESRPNIISIIAIVTATAIFGMLLGGGFGYAAARIAPDMFTKIFPQMDFEPVGTALVLGATGGVICGGGLGAFAVLMRALHTRRSPRENSQPC